MMLHEKMPFAPRCALFSASDALLNCAVRHGLSLVPFEYVLASEVGMGKKGSLIISEFAASSRVIPGVMRLSPWKDEDAARAIGLCLLCVCECVCCVRGRLRERERDFVCVCVCGTAIGARVMFCVCVCVCQGCM